MCFHASQEQKTKKLEEHYKVERSKVFEIEETSCTAKHFNGFDHPELLIIPQESKQELHPAIWGILPKNETGYTQNDYYRNINTKGGGLNAQSEKAFDHFIYKHSIMERRCIIPLTGFFEPHKHKGKGISYPFYFHRKDKSFISVAGIYSITNDGTVSFTMFTKKASEWFGSIHNKVGEKRQIVLLDPMLEKEWLRDDLNEKHIKELFNVQYDESELDAYPVSRDIFNPDVFSNYDSITDKVDYPALQNDKDDQLTLF